MASEQVEIVTGYDAEFALTLLQDGSAFVVPATATVQVAVVTTDHSTRVIAPVASVESPATNWAEGKIVARFSAAQTAAAQPLYRRPLMAEVQVETDSGKFAWFAPGLTLTKGHI